MVESTATFNESDIDISQIDFSDLESQYQINEPELNFDNYVVCDGAPIAPESKAPMLKKVLGKLFNQAGKVIDMYMPIEDGKSKGYLIIEFENPLQANKAVKSLNGKKLDVKHTLLVNKLSDVEKYGFEDNVKDEFEEPHVEDYHSHGYLKSWLLDPSGRDQFMLHYNDTVGVFWNKKDLQPEDAIEPRAHWTSAFMKFSPKGSYLFSLFPHGVQSWGGEKFDRIKRFLHPGVRLIDFSPNENYLVTLSPEPISIPPDNHPARSQCLFSNESEGHKLVIWDLQSGLPVRTFALPPNLEKQTTMPWPLIKWSYDDKYCARMGPDALAIYSTNDEFQLLDKKPIKIEGIQDFEFSPSGVRLSTTRKNDEPEIMLSYWTPESTNQSARVSIMQLPTKQILRTINLFQVSNVKMFWQDEGKYLACKVDRHTKSKKTQFTNLEIIQLNEKDLPVEKLELKEVVNNFQWEPKGYRFVTISHLDIANPNPSAPDSILTFYDIENQKVKQTQSRKVPGGGLISVNATKKWLPFKTIKDKHSNELYFSPRGRFIAIASIKGSANTKIEFYDLDYEGEPDKIEKIDLDNSNKVSSKFKTLNDVEHRGLTNLQWEPSGRFLAGWSSSWKHKIENGYKLYTMVGKMFREELIDGFKEFEWRPRPDSLLSVNDKKKIKKNLKEYAAQFEELDAMEADAELRELILKRKRLLQEWTAWRKETVEHLKELGLINEESHAKEEVIEEIKEVILEETEEVVN
ncbi:hypothetical protein CANARDRAFT_30255 [[Candida] arabinofermentans NRRL YB-2248]|uniref:Eukaryotic translation initiation factor 3 subunit B n=1 Tax=[Candida] arabinofermentans NRRL YB-2248 TaxID=983967 RepID=A0A1E4SUR5_9ASCO|nr:hypothetical protein CANARDRAFT_30255 [[Candida] arabinofermentans NRRL YB-2248]